MFVLADDLSQLLEASTQRYSALIVAKLAQPMDTANQEHDYHTVDINHVEARRKQIYDALNIKHDLIGPRKTVIGKKKSVVPTETG